MPNIETPEGDKFWCTEGCGFVKENHRCEQWGGTLRIPKEAITAIRAESAALLKMCREALEATQIMMRFPIRERTFEITTPTMHAIDIALAALREAGEGGH